MPSDKITSLNHHAYYLTGGTELKKKLIDLLENQHEVKTHANPDFFEKHFESFSIDDAREIKDIHNTRPISEEAKKFFILTIDNITVEAQNALLKLLEEPADYAQFFLIVPNKNVLLPTVRSRLSFLSLDQEMSNDEINEEAVKFIRANKAKRLEIIKKISEDISGDKKPKRYAADFINSVEKEVYEKGDVKANVKVLQALDLARKYINDRSPSIKMLLEYVALSFDAL